MDEGGYETADSEYSSPASSEPDAEFQELDGERDAGGAPLATVAEAERASAEARQQAGISEEDWERGATAGAAAPRGAKQLASLVDANLEGAAANRGGAGAGGAAEQYQQQEEGQQPSLPGCSSTSEAGGFAAPPNAAPLAEAELALAAMDSGSQLVDGAELEEQLSAEEVASRLAAAEALKAEGNELYAAGDLDAAAAKYVAALTAAPVCEAATAARAVFYSNLAAVQLKQDKHGDAVRTCSLALALDGGSVKALMRRSSAQEALDDVEAALADAQKVAELDPRSAWAKAAVARLQPVVVQRQEKLKEEMMGKLKDLGNMVLGKFGLSLDNFKAEQDPATGSYSIKFQR